MFFTSPTGQTARRSNWGVGARAFFSSGFVATVEPLERRALLSATVSGTVLRDLTGNGLTGDDQPLAGVVVKLYRDANANGALDAADGAAVASRTSAAGTGAFAFSGLAAGRYLVAETPGANQVRTAPALGGTIAVNVASANATVSGLRFANYVKDFDRAAVGAITYTINGTRTVSDLAGNVKQGDTVRANFTVAAGKTARLTLVSYHASGPNGGVTALQELANVATKTFAAGAHSLTVKVPDCYFQVDFVGGPAIDPFGPDGSNIRYGAQGRFISGAVGGTKQCVDMGGPPPGEQTGREGLSPGFWKNHTNVWGPTGLSPSQTLESVFDVPDSLGLDNATLLDALKFGGGSGSVGAARILLRQAVAAVLNARHPSVDYPRTSSAVVSSVNTALAGGNRSTILSLSDALDRDNNLEGGIDAHGRPV